MSSGGNQPEGNLALAQEWLLRTRDWLVGPGQVHARNVGARVGRALYRMVRGYAVADVDYRDRISVACWMVVLGLSAGLIFELPQATFTFNAFGSPATVELTGTLWTALFLAVLAGAGAESVVAVHPVFVEGRHQRGVRTWSFWALPMALALLAALLLPSAPSALVQVLIIVVSGMLMALAFFALYATVERGRPGFRRSRLILDAMAYGSALLLFLFVYQARTRSLLSSSLIALTAMLLAIEILRTATPRSSTALIYGAIVGLIMGQVTWALNYWVLPGLTGSLMLLLVFYLLVGIAQQGLLERLTGRVLVEFVVFAAVALLLIALVGPGFA
ncbi:MAG: hypothetical protein WDZ49_17335 [Litorilinea sp.]